MKTVCIIPCRYNSTRFPGKPLADIGGKPMMWHVYQKASTVGLLDEVYIATDDERIESVCHDYNMNCLRTRDVHETGTDRLTECAEKVVADIYVNVQGDEPMIDPCAIEAVTRTMQDCQDHRVMATNAFVPIEVPSDAVNTNAVKVLMTTEGMAMAYSRMAIPYPRGAEAFYRRQLGLYAFRRSGLQLFSELHPGPVELCENVEMLRLVEHGHSILMVQVDHCSIPVDTESDLDRVRQLFKTA